MLLFAVVLGTGLSEPIMGGDAAVNFGVFARAVASTGEYDLAMIEAGRRGECGERLAGDEFPSGMKKAPAWAVLS